MNIKTNSIYKKFKKFKRIFLFRDNLDNWIQIFQLISVVFLSYLCLKIGLIFGDNPSTKLTTFDIFLYSLSLLPIAVYKSYFTDLLVDKLRRDKLVDIILSQNHIIELLFFFLSFIIACLNFIYLHKTFTYVLLNLICSCFYIFYTTNRFYNNRKFLNTFSNYILFITFLVTFFQILAGYCISQNNETFYIFSIILFILLFIF